jgi:hypothetical protein
MWLPRITLSNNTLLIAAALTTALLVASPNAFAARQLTAITLNQADPSKMVSLIQQYLSNGSSVQHYQNQLIINATPEELAKIRALLKQLDAQGKTLWIALRIGEQTQRSEQTVFVTIPPIVVRKNGIQTTTRNTASIQQRGFSASGQQRQGIRATEGVAAYISSGVSVLLNTDRKNSPFNSQQFHEVTNGFYATAWLNGNTVTLELEQRNDQLQSDQIINTQQLQSRVNGAVGKWIPVGMLGDSNNSSSREIGGSTTMEEKTATTIYLKVSIEH